MSTYIMIASVIVQHRRNERSRRKRTCDDRAVHRMHALRGRRARPASRARARVRARARLRLAQPLGQWPGRHRRQPRHTAAEAALVLCSISDLVGRLCGDRRGMATPVGTRSDTGARIDREHALWPREGGADLVGQEEELAG